MSLFTNIFSVRLLEQMILSFLVAFTAVVSATHGEFTKGVVFAAVAAGAQAVYGIFATAINDPQKPTLTK